MPRPPAAAARGLLVHRSHATHPPAEAARAMHRRLEPAQRPRGPPSQQHGGSIIERLISGQLSAAELHEACARSRLEELCTELRFVPRDGRDRQKLKEALTMIAEVAVRREAELRTLSPGHLRCLIHTYAKSTQRVPPLFSAVASAAVRKVGQFNAQNLSLTVWGF
eukprot:Hpha_TRINITY_DN16513_c0_g1::TRINITY_DN16513_c0_g1_i2::g.136916::m.136916